MFWLTAVLLGRATLSIRGTIDDGPVHDALWLPWSFALPFLYAAPIAWLVMRWFRDWRESALELGLRRGRERMVASFDAYRSAGS